MSDDVIIDLVRQLSRVRSVLASDMPGSPAWAATVEWRDELEAQIRSMGRDPDAVDRPTSEARRQLATRTKPRWVGQLPAGTR